MSMIKCSLPSYKQLHVFNPSRMIYQPFKGLSGLIDLLQIQAGLSIIFVVVEMYVSVRRSGLLFGN